MATKTQKSEMPEDITKQLKLISSEIEQLKNGAKPSLEEKLHEVGSNVRGFLDSSKTAAVERVEAAQETIKKNPIRNTAIAFAAGALLTALLSRK